MITIDQFREILPNCQEPDQWCQLLEEELPQFGFETPTQVSMFIAQTAHESNEYNVLEENLNYSADRLRIVFPKYFRNFSPAQMQQYHRNPVAIANLVYANRMGNGAPETGDGYKFRGKGVIQLTGKNNHMKCSEFLFGHEDILVDSPELLLHIPNAFGSAMWFWQANNLLAVNDMVALTQKINGGQNGIAQRMSIYNVAMQVLG
jgi:putative chitinase